MAKQILVVDDDALMRRTLAVNLDQAGYMPLAAASAEEAIRLLSLGRPDLILLDIGLPGMDGLEALREIRHQAGDVPVVFLTARRRELDEIVGLELGADDYITKPFDMDVLLAHIRAVLRRSEARVDLGGEEVVRVGDLTIDPASREVCVGERQLVLPPKEFELLLTLARHPGRVFSVDELLHQVWGSHWIGESQTVYVHVRWLRQKIEEEPAHPRRLLSLRGMGYKLVPANA